MEKEIVTKAEYCLSCTSKNCKKGCPLSNDITKAIAYVKEKKYKEAYEEFLNTTVLSSICGRICPHNKQCQGRCVMKDKFESISIGKIESFIGDFGLKNNINIPYFKDYRLLDKKVAVIGSGPCGITCAATLKRLGIKNVTIFEKKEYLGGLLVHGIPDFRLNKNIVKDVYSKILALGIKVEYNKELGVNLFINELQENYDAVFIAIGANISSKMNIPGEELHGVYGGNELLEYKNFPNLKNKRVAVIGGGNVAMDTSRTVKRLGAEKVYIIYRRDKEQMPAEIKEIKEAKKEGIEFIFLTNVVRILGDKKVSQIECVDTRLIYEDEKRPYPINIENTNYLMDIDYVIMAVGSNVQKDIIKQLNIKTDKWYNIEVDSEYKTSLDKVYAAGDVAGVKSTVAWASVSGREAAEKIYKHLKDNI